MIAHMIARVVPAVRLPPSAGPHYDYLVPRNLAPAITPGSVVVIPFAGRRVGGLVVDTVAESEYKNLKEIAGVALGLSPLPSYSVELWKKLADIFAAPLPRFVWMALPVVPVRAIEESTMGGPKNRRVNPQTLTLTPTVREAEVLARDLGDATIYHAALSTGEKYRIASGTNSGTITHVVGTKSAVFLPFGNLAEITIAHAGSSSHLQEDSDPRFDARVAAQELAAMSGAKLHVEDALPPLGLIVDPSMLPVMAVTIHDLDDARRRERSRVLLGESLETAIDEAIAAQMRVLVLLNRRGVSTALICKDCGKTVLCPSCAIPVSIQEVQSVCPACERAYPLPGACERCRGTNLSPIGAGSKTLYQLIQKRHPKANVMHIDRDTENVDPDSAQVVIGTTAIFRALGPRPKKFDLIADALLGAGTGKAGVWSVEETARIARTLGTLVAPEGSLHIQTFDSVSPALLALTDPAAFVAREMAEREALGYPPAKTLVNLLGSGVEEQALWSEALVVRSKLIGMFPRGSVLEPVWSRPKRFRGKFRLTVTLKLPRGATYPNLVKSLPSGWAAEVRKL